MDVFPSTGPQEALAGHSIFAMLGFGSVIAVPRVLDGGVSYLLQMVLRHLTYL